MYNIAALALVTQFLVLNVNAQNNTGNSTELCLDLEDAVKYNSSSSRTIPALRLNGDRPVDRGDTFSIEKDLSRTWELSLRVQSMAINQARGMNNVTAYRQTMFLNTGDSNMTDIGSCHQSIQPESRMLKFQWTREVMERSLQDNGDCGSLLGDKCVEALKIRAANEAAEWPLRTGSCAGMNSSMPPECSGTVSPRLSGSRQMNLTYLNGINGRDAINRGNNNSAFDPSLTCNDVNISSSHSVEIAEYMSYEAAVRFPTIDLITFWPNRTSGLSYYVSNWWEDVHVELVCMRPDSHITEWSDTPASGSELLSREEATFPTPNSASTLSSGVLVWISAAIMALMIIT
ncbi:hypothetical protein DE146DRAFT_761934 [Phaeosphaeria sp. MPI-PUGE-AT-0046c]|nr:hypothetical protein DE146DRAFT_761934 [Phaeosphaeria sp. MPI-PUGE-AT-0046c]